MGSGWTHFNANQPIAAHENIIANRGSVEKPRNWATERHRNGVSRPFGPGNWRPAIGGSGETKNVWPVPETRAEWMRGVGHAEYGAWVPKDHGKWMNSIGTWSVNQTPFSAL